MVVSAMGKNEEVRAESADGWEWIMCCKIKLESGH